MLQIIQNKNAQAIESKYGNFNFPAIPEDDALQNELMQAQRPKPTNNFLSQADPMKTNTSIQSVNSVNLERINQRNADRLAKLENHEFADDSAMQLTMGSLKTRPYEPSRQSVMMKNESIPVGMTNSITIPNAAPQQPNREERMQITELEQLDDMLAGLLREK